MVRDRRTCLQEQIQRVEILSGVREHQFEDSVGKPGEGAADEGVLEQQRGAAEDDRLQGEEVHQDVMCVLLWLYLLRWWIGFK